MKKAHILVVEDDENLRFVIKDNLSREGYQVTACADGDTAWQYWEQAPYEATYDLCILDIMLPKLDGFSLAHKIRKVDAHTPILMLTARSLPEDKINGFQSGADDYILKPFDMQELILRVEVFLQRPRRVATIQHDLSIGKYQFDHQNLTLTIADQSRSLTAKEAEVLKLFIDHQGELLKREFILKMIWGDDDYFMGRSLDVFISRLRKYLKDDPNLKITNHHGVGFQLTLLEA